MGRHLSRVGMQTGSQYILKSSSASNNSVTKRVVAVESAGQRIDNYLLRLLKGVPKSHVYRILRSGEVRVNSRRCAPTYRIEAGDEIRLPPLRLAERAAPEPEMEAAMATAAAGVVLPVLYEDEALIALDKPAGIAVHGGSGISFGVIEALRRQRPEARFLELAHRLDRETSGILLIGKKRSALNRLHELFRHGGQGTEKLDKRYLVLVRGRWMESLRHARFPLLKYLAENDGEGERRVRVSEEGDGGKYAHTVFRLRARWQRFSLLEAQLKTGRTHQIRVHLAHLGYPVAGDDKYGDFTLNKALRKEGLKRMFLHAAWLSLPYPGNRDSSEGVREEPLLLEAPLPPELDAFLVYLARTETQDYGKKL